MRLLCDFGIQAIHEIILTDFWKIQDLVKTSQKLCSMTHSKSKMYFKKNK